MPRYNVQFKHRPGAASVAITADNAEMAISEAASVLRLTPMDIGDPINDVVDFSCILEAIEQPEPRSIDKTTFKAYWRSIRDNGARYTMAHAPLNDQRALMAAWVAAQGEDMLADRESMLRRFDAGWLDPDTSRSTIVRLTSIIF